MSTALTVNNNIFQPDLFHQKCDYGTIIKEASLEVTEMKKRITAITLILTGICLILSIFFILIFIISPIFNDHTAKNTADELAALPLPDHTELIESIYQTGKLVGNGNGIQYFGAILIQSGLSLEELQEYYKAYAKHDWECVVEKQAGAEITFIEHESLAFQTKMEGDNYYIVYSWGSSSNSIFQELDIRGH